MNNFTFLKKIICAGVIFVIAFSLVGCKNNTKTDNSTGLMSGWASLGGGEPSPSIFIGYTTEKKTVNIDEDLSVKIFFGYNSAIVFSDAETLVKLYMVDSTMFDANGYGGMVKNDKYEEILIKEFDDWKTRKYTLGRTMLESPYEDFIVPSSMFSSEKGWVQFVIKEFVLYNNEFAGGESNSKTLYYERVGEKINLSTKQPPT